MKTLNSLLIATALIATGATAALATDAPTLRQQAEQTFLLTGDATAAKAAGISDAQIGKMKAQPFETVQLPSE